MSAAPIANGYDARMAESIVRHALHSSDRETLYREPALTALRSLESLQPAAFAELLGTLGSAERQVLTGKLRQLPKISAAKARPAPRITSGNDLMAQTFVPLVEVVPGLLPEGLMILGARPKVGKSWLALQLGVAVATGGEFLGRTLAPGRVLYLALEDSDRRMRLRLEKLGAAGLDLSRFHYATAWERGLDGAAAINEWVQAHEDARLVVVDVLAKIKQARNGRDAGYASDFDDVTLLKPQAGRGVAVLLVHHTRKGAADDPLDEISGTLGIAGAADGAWVLKRARGQDEAELNLIGRDVAQEGAFAVRFDRATCRWEWIGDAWRVQLSAERRAIVDALADGALAPIDIAKAIGKKPDAVRYLLAQMLREGQVDKGLDRRYRLIEQR